jgi:hypothetical protein
MPDQIRKGADQIPRQTAGPPPAYWVMAIAELLRPMGRAPGLQFLHDEGESATEE